MIHNRYFPYLLLALGTFFWSTNFLIGRVLASGVPPFTITAGRFAVAALIFAIMAIWYRWPLPKGKQWYYVIAMAFTGVLLFNTVLYWGLQYTTAINATLVNGFSPLVTMLLVVLILKEKASPRLFLGIIFSVCGVFFVATKGSLEVLLQLSLNQGDLIILLGALIWSLYTIVVRTITKEYPVLPATAYATLLGAVMLIPAVYWEAQQTPIVITGTAIASFIYLGVFASVAAFICWNWAVSKIGPMKATLFYNLIPLYAAILSPIFLGEKLLLLHLIGGILIVGGVVTAVWQRAAPKT
jgi:drug/metabolite transporter (DMT)-like permease